VRNEARQPPEAQHAEEHLARADQDHHQAERALPRFSGEAAERLPGGERGRRGGRDHHELRARKEPADERPHHRRVEPVQRIHADEHGVRHAVGHVCRGQAEARNPVAPQGSAAR
jgi:hypothetical protein